MLFILSGFRDGVGTDYKNYEYLVYSYVNGGSTETDRLEPGFQLIFNIVSISSNSPRIFFLLTSFLILLFFFLGFLKYSRSLLLSIFLFVTLYYYFNSLNGVRQFLAMALVLCFSTRFLVEKNFLKYIISIIFAALFHVSALIMLPAYFLNKKFDSRAVLLFLILLPMVFISYDAAIGFIFNYFSYYQVYSDYNSGSASAFIIIQLALIILVFFSYRNNKQWTTEELVSLNFSIISLFFFVLSYKNIMFFRLGLFFSMYLLILVPAALTEFKSSKNRVVFYFLCTVLGIVSLSYHLYYNVSDVLPFRLNFVL